MRSQISPFLVLFFCALSFHTYAQRKWDNKYYQRLNNQNFRESELFKAPINLKKIDYARLNAAVFYVSNEARDEAGLPMLEYQENLEIMAWNHSRSMGEKNFFDHINSKDKKRKKPEQRARLAGITNPNVGENISSQGGYRYASYLELADNIVDGWIDSPSHRMTLYSPGAIQLGCGVYYFAGTWQKNKEIKKQGDGFWIATQNLQIGTKVKPGKAKDKGPG